MRTERTANSFYSKKFYYNFAPSFHFGAVAFLSIAVSRNVLIKTAPVTNMENLLNFLNEGRAHVKVEMSAEDLKAFSDDLIRRAKDELGSMVEAAKKERMLTKTEVKELFGVCNATLWHWANKGILKPVKTGNKVLYPEYEVRKALGNRNLNI